MIYIPKDLLLAAVFHAFDAYVAAVRNQDQGGAGGKMICGMQSSLMHVSAHRCFPRIARQNTRLPRLLGVG